MTTEAQIKANQMNAKRSTGPTSIEGKKRSSTNAMTHGILSTITTLPGEDEAFMQGLREDILTTYQPTDTMERCLVDRITMAMVRQVRLFQAEAEKLKLSMRPEVMSDNLSNHLRHVSLMQARSSVSSGDGGGDLMDHMRVISRIPQGVDITLMTRYQVQLDNDLYRAMNALQKYREHKPKVIEGEIVDEVNHDEGIAA